MHSRRYLFDQNNLQSIDDVLLALETLEHDLSQDQLGLLRNFNMTYLIITRNVRQQLRRHTFASADFLTRFDTRFAYYYFDALQAYIYTQQAPPAWVMAFNATEDKRSSPTLCMALGVNAHVNNDIPQVLLDCNASEEEYGDYVAVNNSITDSIYEVIDALWDDGSLINPKRRAIRPVYKVAMKQLIRLWRSRSWSNYKKLRQGIVSVRDIELLAKRTAVHLTKLPI